MSKERADVLLQHQLGVSRSKAQGLIETGNVFGADGQPVTKPGARFEIGSVFTVREQQKFVSRGGFKLEHALDTFPITIEGRVAIDVGASTGGFTDCLLQRGAKKVYAIDVGYGQLAWNLRQDPRVQVFERTNIRHLKPDALQEAPDCFVVDCSFISLRLVLPPLKALLAPKAEGVVLIKPQFEAGRNQVGKGGVVRDVSVRNQVVRDVADAAQSMGYTVLETTPSPILGPAGNEEFLAHLRNS